MGLTTGPQPSCPPQAYNRRTFPREGRIMRRWIARCLASAAGEKHMGPVAEGRDRLVQSLAWLWVLGLIAFQLLRMIPSLWLPWYHKSDELVLAYEVIRFLRLDFHQ